MKILITLALLLVATGVSAQTTTLPINGDGIQKRAMEVKSTLEEKAERHREKLQLHQENAAERLENKRERIEGRRIQLQARHQERVSSIVGRILGHVDIIIERFENIIERFESRVSKMEENGVEMSEIQEVIDNAKVEIKALKDIIAEVGENIDTLLGDEVSREDIRAEVESVREAIHDTKDAIISALRVFKASVKIDTIN